jgi:hypothetical protein
MPEIKMFSVGSLAEFLKANMAWKLLNDIWHTLKMSNSEELDYLMSDEFNKYKELSYRLNKYKELSYRLTRK